jgi:GT2 family glycosyltransferase
VIATRDRPESIARCVGAVIAGDVRPHEIVVVDQGVRPLGPNVLPGADGVDVVVLRDEGVGLSRARNVAIKVARCPVIAVLDDDCVPAAGWLAAITAAFGADGATGGVSGPVLPMPPEHDRVFTVSSRTSAAPAEYAGGAVPWRVGTGGNFAARTQLVRDLGGYDCRLGAGSPSGAGEDIDLIYRMLRAGARIRYNPNAVVRHERVAAARRRATRRSYGRGIGAFVGVHVRQGDLQAGMLLLRWMLQRVALLARAALRLDRLGVTEEVIVLSSTAVGVRLGLRLGPRRGQPRQ